ncbi:MAG: ABC transporter ATP-binding protein [Candidatus Marinimicrobia bacterium]|nr:ABC transporter ATP-binding protein [Candidatus Neomarinimicrobiota bacterium]
MTEYVLSVSNLTKSYGHRKAVDNLSFDVGEGEIFGFLGPNGAGKSTTIRMMLALVKPDKGEIKIFGKSIIPFRNRVLRGVGAVIEEPSFYKNLSARRNLQMLADLESVSRSRVDEVLEMVRLSDRGNDKLKAYSHGMKQRLGIAQALLSKPRLLILDEPTSGLDPRGMKEVRDLIKSLALEGISIFLSSHLLHEVEQVCTSMAIIDLGKLIISGNVDDLLKETDLFVAEIQATPIEKARKIIDQFDFVKNVNVIGNTLKVGVTTHRLPEITKALVENGLEVTSVIPRRSLEDYFLSLTEEVL